MRTQHVPQRCASPPYDGDPRVRVGVILMAAADAGDAGEACLALAAPRIHHTARRAGPRREPRRDARHPPAALLHLVGQDRREPVPPRVQDRPVRPRPLADVTAWLGHCPAGGRAHAAGVQAFRHRDAEATRGIERGAVVDVAPDVGLARLQPGDPCLGPALAVRAALAAGHDALRLPLARLDPLQTKPQPTNRSGTSVFAVPSMPRSARR